MFDLFGRPAATLLLILVRFHNGCNGIRIELVGRPVTVCNILWTAAGGGTVVLAAVGVIHGSVNSTPLHVSDV